MFSVIGALAALHESQASGQGQEVDVAIYEAVAALMESSMADFELGGVLRERSGGILPGVAPSNAYPTIDGFEVVIAANADAVFARLCTAMGQPELVTDPRFDSHVHRGNHLSEIDQIVARWTSALTADQLLQTLDENGVPAGKIFSARDMLKDDHYLARDMVIRKRSNEGWEVPMPGVVPKFSRTRGEVRFVGPLLGADTRDVLTSLGGLSSDELDVLESRGVIFSARNPDSSL